MAYLLFKYIRRKLQERKNATAEPGQETPEIPATHQSPKASKTLGINDGESSGAATVPGQDHVVNMQDEAGPTTDVSTTNAEEKARIKAETHRRRVHRWKLIIGLSLPSFLAAVDTTIVAPAVPVISSHFNHLSGSFNWIVTAYTLTITTFVPVAGQFSDVYGRHAALHFLMFCLMIGSVFCAAAVTWPMLLFGRGLQGVGASGIMSLTRVILSDNQSLADNSKNNTIFSMIAGMSYSVGPVIGGYLANSNWRYCFVISIGIAFISHILIFFLLRKELVKGKVSLKDTTRNGPLTGLLTFDWPGIFFFIFGVGLLILAIQWGGVSYAWSSPATIVPLVLGILLFLIFWAHEYLLEPGRPISRLFPNQAPMIPWSLFSRPDTLLLSLINFGAGAALFSAFYFISIYWELAENYSASDAGVQLLYYTPGLGVGVYTAMFLCNVWPRQTFYPLSIGSTVEAVGFALLTWAVRTRKKALVNAMMAVSGAGTGLRFMPVVLHAAGTWPTKLASIMSLLTFMLEFGGTLGISMMGSVFSNKFNKYLQHIAPEAATTAFGAGGKAPNNIGALQSLPEEVKVKIQDAAVRAVMWSFVSILPFMAVSVGASLLLGNVWIGRPAKEAKAGKAGKPEVKGKVLGGVFLLAALRGRAGTDRWEVDYERAQDEVRKPVADEKKRTGRQYSRTWV